MTEEPLTPPKATFGRTVVRHRHWLWRLFLVLIVVSVYTPIPIWAVFVPFVVALLARPPRRDEVAPARVAAPVRGRWVAINSPANSVPSHGVRTLGQAFAIDIAHPDGGEASLGWGLVQRRPETYTAFGAPVLAVAPGRVVAALDARGDHRARSTWPGVLYMLIAESFGRELGGPSFILGNHVIVEHTDGRYAVYAHLQRGSVAVRRGEEVLTGQQLGVVGNSGNTSEPHLHAQLMDHPDPSAAAGLPFRWDGITMEPGDLDPRWLTEKGRREAAERELVEGLPATGQIFTAQDPGEDRTPGFSGPRG